MLCLLACVVLHQTASESAPQAWQQGPIVPLERGAMQVFWKANTKPTKLLVHFHGANETVKSAFVRCGSLTDDHALLVVNYKGLSAVYAKPFETNQKLFAEMLADAHKHVVGPTSRDHTPTSTWQRVSVSCFSAGFGAVREILKQSSNADLISTLVTADSIYAGLVSEKPTRQVNPANMNDFLTFAQYACEGKKTFILSHCDLVTPYASTKETADYLLAKLTLKRESVSKPAEGKLLQASSASKGNFQVLGFAGTTGEDHMAHLRQIDVFWKIAIRRSN